MQNRYILAFAGTTALALLANGVRASAIIVDPVAATASSKLDYGTGQDRDPSNTIGMPIDGDSTGLSSPLVTGDAAPASDSLYPTQSIDPSTMWLSNGGITGQYIQFDLGADYANYNLTGFHLWNYNEGTTDRDRGVATGTLAFSNDPSFALANILSEQAVTLSEATGAGTDTGVTYALTSPASAEYVRLTVATNFNASDGYTGISEIRFLASVPEPGSLSLIAISAIGALRRRRLEDASGWRGRSGTLKSGQVQ
jgi:hypothetical protein